MSYPKYMTGEPRKQNWWSTCLSPASKVKVGEYGRNLSAAETAQDFAPFWWEVSDELGLVDEEQCRAALERYRGRRRSRIPVRPQVYVHPSPPRYRTSPAPLAPRQPPVFTHPSPPRYRTSPAPLAPRQPPVFTHPSPPKYRTSPAPLAPRLPPVFTQPSPPKYRTSPAPLAPRPPPVFTQPSPPKYRTSPAPLAPRQPPVFTHPSPPKYRTSPAPLAPPPPAIYTHPSPPKYRTKSGLTTPPRAQARPLGSLRPPYIPSSSGRYLGREPRVQFSPRYVSPSEYTPSQFPVELPPQAGPEYRPIDPTQLIRKSQRDPIIEQVLKNRAQQKPQPRNPPKFSPQRPKLSTFLEEHWGN